MFTLSDTWIDLLGFSGLFNPIALVIGIYLGWHANQAAKIWIAGFAAAILSLIAEAAWGFTGLPHIISQDAGALAMFPFRFVGGAAAAAIVYHVRRLRR
ncbi:phosphatidylglycerophosphatase [Roseibium sp. RKSG952]|uniref:phosphatidylglycerophosphatase n=1 Tax=Roseibium sp. RKSG952 TaxID=2529384 RepID=UPI0012BD521B|nr:phosphatidylglycerophosphatase [Roseibium sp. RKSG952]MTH95787.1 phosphatidylglycerophosphatase [Roseibium sp. RKSG952]